MSKNLQKLIWTIWKTNPRPDSVRKVQIKLIWILKEKEKGIKKWKKVKTMQKQKNLEQKRQLV